MFTGPTVPKKRARFADIIAQSSSSKALKLSDDGSDEEAIGAAPARGGIDAPGIAEVSSSGNVIKLFATAEAVPSRQGIQVSITVEAVLSWEEVKISATAEAVGTRNGIEVSVTIEAHPSSLGGHKRSLESPAESGRKKRRRRKLGRNLPWKARDCFEPAMPPPSGFEDGENY